MTRLIESIGTAVPSSLVEVARLGRTQTKRRDDILAFFDHTGSSNGPHSVANLMELGLTLAAVATIVWCGVYLAYSPRHAAAKQPRVDTPSPPHLQDAGDDHPDPHARRTQT